jgi:hypothetical protein
MMARVAHIQSASNIGILTMNTLSNDAQKPKNQEAKRHFDDNQPV